MDRLLSNLKLKYQEYFTKIIIIWDEARYHLVHEIDKLLKSEEIMGVTIPYNQSLRLLNYLLVTIKKLMY